jgi:hypothetical protein
MLQYRVYLRELLPFVGLKSEGYLLVSESELDSLIEGQSIVKELTTGETQNIYYSDLKMIVKDY